MKYYPGIIERIGFDFYADIAVRVVETRKERGLTQKQLAEELEWTVSKLASLEAVKIRISLKDLEELSKALEVSANYLLEAYDDSPVGDCLYLVNTDSCMDLRLYVKASNGRIAILKLEKELNDRGIRFWSNARERGYVERVGVPIARNELKDRFGSYDGDRTLERGKEEWE